MKLSSLFRQCLNREYVKAGDSADYSVEKAGSKIYIYFQCSDGAVDWKNNLNFPAIPYETVDGQTWYAHGGFVRVWRSIENYIAKYVNDDKIRSAVIVGYSHGAALALLCHEYIWYNRADLRDHIEGYGFGCPRVLWGKRTEKVTTRWKNFTVIRNINDAITHMPPAILGYYHVGKMLKIGQKGKYSSIDAHRPENILSELYLYENKLENIDKEPTAMPL